MVARLPLAALGLIFVLHVQERTGSFALAGLASGAYALGLGASAPLLGRLIDARGLRAIVPACAGLSAAALLAAAALPNAAPAAALVALAALAGLSMPPLGACLRALWVGVLTDADRRHAAFALDSAAGEILYVIGPVGLAGGIAAWSAPAALAVSAACIVGGALAFVRVSGRAEVTAGERAAGRAGALGSPAVRSLIGVFALLGVAFGGVEVGVAAAAATSGTRGLAGPLLGLWGVGSVIGALLAVRMGAARDGAGRLTVLLGALALAHAPLAIAGGPLALAPLLLVSGVTIAPTLSTAMTLVGEAAPIGTLTEAFTWSSTGITAGIAVGAAGGGALIEAVGPGSSFTLAAAACALAAVVGVLRRPVLAAA
jgi:predicted MFS family arabinose efflux permease